MKVSPRIIIIFILYCSMALPLVDPLNIYSYLEGRFSNILFIFYGIELIISFYFLITFLKLRKWFSLLLLVPLIIICLLFIFWVSIYKFF